LCHASPSMSEPDFCACSLPLGRACTRLVGPKVRGLLARGLAPSNMGPPSETRPAAGRVSARWPPAPSGQDITRGASCPPPSRPDITRGASCPPEPNSGSCMGPPSGTRRAAHRVSSNGPPGTEPLIMHHTALQDPTRGAKELGRLNESPASNPCTDFVRTRLRPAAFMPSPHADRQTRLRALASCSPGFLPTGSQSPCRTAPGNTMRPPVRTLA